MIYKKEPYMESLEKQKQSWLIVHSNNHFTILKFLHRFQYLRNISFPCNHTSSIGDLFIEVRAYESFKYLQLGLISELKRKS